MSKFRKEVGLCRCYDCGRIMVGTFTIDFDHVHKKEETTLSQCPCAFERVGTMYSILSHAPEGVLLTWDEI